MAFLKKSQARFIRIFGIVTGSVVIIILGLHLWFVHNARIVLKQYITEQSEGKIKLELSKLNLNLWTKNIQIHEAVLVSTDSLTEPVTYGVAFSELSLNVGSIWGLLFKKRLLLDSVKLYNAVIQVIQWRNDTTTPIVKDELSIPQEMGKVYTSMLNALNEFGIRRIIIDNAAISLINKMKPSSEPVTISNIYFDLARTPVKDGKKNVYLENEHTVELKTTDQQISLPGGRHKISFKSFNLQLFRQSIELDSCTITAIATDSVKSSYNIFFNKLSLTGVDFAALSTNNVIKADTVYCENPLFNFDLYRSDAVKNQTEIPDPNKIIRELTGNFDLAYVEVKNAGIYFDVHGKTKRSFFNTGKDNFAIRAFRINPDSSQPVSIGRFDMTLRDYNLYNEDSSTAYSFDSLHFLNNKIVLSNFALFNKPRGGTIQNHIDIKVPYFELTDLDWYQAIFEQNMVAQSAVLNNPTINFTRKKVNKPGRKFNLFNTLLNLDSLVELDNVSVINGQVNMQLGAAASFEVQNINFHIYSNRFLSSTNKEGLRNAVDHFSFSKAVLRIKDVTAQLENASYTGKNLMYAGKVSVSGKENKIAATINNVYIDNMLLDDNAEEIEVDGIRWESASVALNVLPSKKSNNNLHLRNVAGNNTGLKISNGATVITSFIKTLSADALIKKGTAPLRVEGFDIAGNNFLLNNRKLKLSAADYRLSGDDASLLKNVQVQQITGRDTLNITTPAVNFSADLNDIIANNIHLNNVHTTDLVVHLNKWDTSRITRDSSYTQSPIRIDKLTALEPEIVITTHRDDSVNIINIPKSYNSIVQATDIVLAVKGMEIGWLNVNTTAASFVKPTGEVLGIEKGKIAMDLSKIKFGRTEGKINWSGSINELTLENENGLQIGNTNNNFLFQKASVGNLHLSSAHLPDFEQIIKANVSAWLRIPEGKFIDSNTTINWYNAAFNNSTGILSLDSFIYHPTKSLDSVLAHAPYALDYMTLKTGAVNISGLDVAQYEKDSSFIAKRIKINDPILTIYRDQGPPTKPFKKEKPLLVNMIKNISLPISVEDIQLEDATIIYTERNGKSREEGYLIFTDVNAVVYNIKNRNLLEDDSLSIAITAKLMDSANLTLHLKESYTDTLSGFVLTAKINSADLSILNPMIVPFGNVKVTSGVLDSVSFRIIGREDVALGEMDLHYENLKIKLVKDGDPDRSTFLQNVLSFAINTFVIRSSNSKRKGSMYYKRIPTQSFVNYIVKTTLSGIATSVGAKKSRKYIKQYKQEIKDDNNPEIKL